MGGKNQTILVHLASGVGNITLATPLLVALNERGCSVDVLIHADYPQTADLLCGWSLIRNVYNDYSQIIRILSTYDFIIPAIPPFYWSRFVYLHRDTSKTVRRPPDTLFYTDEQEYYLAFARELDYPPDRKPLYRLPMRWSLRDR